MSEVAGRCAVAVIYVWGLAGAAPPALWQWEQWWEEGWLTLHAARPGSALCVVAPGPAPPQWVPEGVPVLSVASEAGAAEIWTAAGARLLGSPAAPADGYGTYVWLTSSAAGPYCLRSRGDRCWIDVFEDLLKDDVVCVGPTIRAWKEDARYFAYVQGYAMVFRGDVIATVTCASADVGPTVTCASASAVEDTESGDDATSEESAGADTWAQAVCARLLRAGHNLSCAVPEYQERDYRWVRGLWNYAADATEGDVTYPGFRCHGRDIHPYETVFVSVEHRLAIEAAVSLARMARQGRLKAARAGDALIS